MRYNSPVFVIDNNERSHQITNDDEKLESRFECASVQDIVSFVHEASAKELHQKSFALKFETCTDRVVDKNNTEMDEKYLTLALQVDQKSQSDLERLQQLCKLRWELLVVDCISHDQGWATTAEDRSDEFHGTYDDSWTWSEMAIEKPHVDKCDPELSGSPRIVVAKNVRADGSYRHHRRYFTDPELLNGLEFGDQVHLFIRAQFPRWANYVQYARIAAYMSVYPVQQDSEADSSSDSDSD